MADGQPLYCIEIHTSCQSVVHKIPTSCQSVVHEITNSCQSVEIPISHHSVPTSQQLPVSSVGLSTSNQPDVVVGVDNASSYIHDSLPLVAYFEYVAVLQPLCELGKLIVETILQVGMTIVMMPVTVSILF